MINTPSGLPMSLAVVGGTDLKIPADVPGDVEGAQEGFQVRRALDLDQGIERVDLQAGIGLAEVAQVVGHRREVVPDVRAQGQGDQLTLRLLADACPRKDRERCPSLSNRSMP